LQGVWLPGTEPRSNPEAGRYWTGFVPSSTRDAGLTLLEKRPTATGTLDNPNRPKTAKEAALPASYNRIRGVIVSKNVMSLERLIASVKQHPEISRAGMILCHNGIVRGCDRSGENLVSTLRVAVDRSAIERIRSWAESRPGIVAVAIEAFEGEFQVGEDLLYVVVAGDVRENVFSVMRETVERIKAEGVHKAELYLE